MNLETEIQNRYPWRKHPHCADRVVRTIYGNRQEVVFPCGAAARAEFMRLQRRGRKLAKAEAKAEGRASCAK